MKTLGRCPPREGGGKVGVFHHPFDRDVETLSGFSPKKESFEVLVRLRWAMKNALVAAPGLADGLPTFFIALLAP
jgi:hypothetical protein